MRHLVHLSSFALFVFSASCSDEPISSRNSNSNNTTVTDSGLDSRPTNTTCVAQARPQTAANSLATEPLFDDTQGMSGVLDMTRGPVSHKAWWAISQNGEVRVLNDSNSGSAQVLLSGSDLTALKTGGERGLLSIALDPNYPNGSNADLFRFYLLYTSNTCDVDNFATRHDGCSYVSRFEATIDSAGVYSVGAEDILMRVRQPYGNHNGGAVRFDNQGHLLIGLGDGGSGGDPHCAGQNIYTPLGKILRIDVHTTLSGYSIPEGNPFKRSAGSSSVEHSKCDFFSTVGDSNSPDLSRNEPCPEILAYGMRNPFRFEMDSDNGMFWIGDVGQDSVEEVDIMDSPPTSAGFGLPNLNYGWPMREGDQTFSSGACAAIESQGDRYYNTTYIAPAFVAHHSDVGSRGVIIGGPVYRGAALGTQYFGRAFFHDAQSGEHWVMGNPYAASDFDVDGRNNSDLTTSAYGYALDDDGEVILLTAFGNARRIILSSGLGSSTFPTKLSQTGCFDSANPVIPVVGQIPYEINAPLWTDGASKERYLAIPDGEVITVDAEGEFVFPIGSVISKHFRAASGELLESRLLMRHRDAGGDDDWGNYAYAWDSEGSDATLVEDSTYLPRHDWTIPSRSDCLRCHSATPGFTIGLTLAQLNRDFTYPSTQKTANQLQTLSAIGIIAPTIVDARTQPLITPFDDAAASTEDLARSYLHGNCAHCHRPNGPVLSAVDFRYDVDFADAGICDQIPFSTNPWPDGARILKPGDPDLSLLYLRLNTNERSRRMPPLARDVIDDDGVALLQQWITSIAACP